VLVEQLSGERDHLRVELLPASRLSPPISKIAARRGSNAKRTRVVPDAQLFHVRVARALDAVHERATQTRSTLLKNPDRSIDCLLVLCAQRVPPHLELVCELHIPHRDVIPLRAYSLERIIAGVLRGVRTTIDRYYGHLARDGRQHAFQLLDALNAPAATR
jgi:hypothetical protein